MKPIILCKDEIYSGNLILVNAHIPLHDTAITDLSSVGLHFPNILLRHDAAKMLRLILEKIAAKNSIVPVSGYRCFAEQKSIYESSLKENGEDFTRKYVALPGHSEHQTGLAIDLGQNQADIDFICPNFPYEGDCNKFRKAAPDFGFIERYTKGKEEMTGISHEPWHFRYVGYPHSKIMTENGLSLEEYIEFIKSFRKENRYAFRDRNRFEIEVFFVPSNKEITKIFLPEESVYQVSGNNCDGFIVTVWRKP